MHDFSVLWSGKYYQYWENVSHNHSYYQIIAVLKGGGEILIGQQRLPLAEHQVFFIHPHVEHAVLRSSEDVRPKLMDIKFSINDDQLAKDLSLLQPILNVGSFSIFQNYFEQILRESAAGKPYSYNCICHYFGLMLMMILRSQAGSTEEQQESAPTELTIAQCGGVDMEKVVHFIQQNYASPISLEDLARIANVSKSTLIQAFKLALDTTPIKYINHIRLSKAKELLLNTDSNISEISEMVGFQSLHYFSRYFKNREQISPVEYRQRYSSSHFYTYRQPNDAEEPGLL